MTQWSVFTLRSGNELSACDELVAAGLQAYCPIVKSLTKPKRKEKPIEIVSAAFPGYLFSSSMLADFPRTSLINSSRLNHLRLGDEFCSIDESEIERLRLGDEDRTVVVDNKIKFTHKDSVKVISGPFVGRDGVVLSVRGQNIKLALSDSDMIIQMPTFSLEKVEAATAVQ